MAMRVRLMDNLIPPKAQSPFQRGLACYGLFMSILLSLLSFWIYVDVSLSAGISSVDTTFRILVKHDLVMGREFNSLGCHYWSPSPIRWMGLC